jgi:Zn-dependent peptidase ImmA (M78 family)
LHALAALSYNVSVPGYDTNVGAKRARDYRAELGLAPDEPLTCLVEVIEQRVGIPVAVVDMAPGYAGAYLLRGGRPSIFVNASDWPTRKRFTLAHELGHHRLGHEPVIDTWEAMYASDRPPEETQANAFAAEFVAPKAGILRFLCEHDDPAINLDLICRLSARFGLSAEATRYRLATIGLLRNGALAARLDQEIRAREHEDLVAHLGLEYPDDELARRHGKGPRLPAGHAAGMLGAVLRGDADAATAAARAGRDPAQLQRALDDAGIPC